jgi:hypothetical protein
MLIKNCLIFNNQTTAKEMLTNFPKIRIKQYKQGYAIEIKKRTWYGMKKWVHIVSYSGLSSNVFYYSTYKHAMKNLLFLIECDIIKNS